MYLLAVEMGLLRPAGRPPASPTGLPDQNGQPAVGSYTVGGAVSYVIRDQQGDPLGMIRGGKSYMYLTDNLGSVITLIGSDGAADGSYAWTSTAPWPPRAPAAAAAVRRSPWVA